MTEHMPFLLKLRLRIARGRPSRRDAIYGARTAWAKLTSQDWPAAVYFAQAAVASDPTWSEGYRMLGLAYRGQERFEEARTALQEALNTGLGDYRVLMDFGDLERTARQFDAAEGLYRRVLEFKPADSEATWKLARALEGQGRLEEAIDVLTQARALSQDDIQIAKALGDVLTERGAYDDALPLLEEVTLRDPNDAFGHYYQALALEGTGKRSEALLHANKAVELDPANTRYQQLVQSLQLQDN
jgi:tetratricopeptide (TPR) repeat protein